MDWGQVVTDAYVAETKPPLTEPLTEKVRDALSTVLATHPADAANDTRLERLNGALDDFERALGSVVGPRVKALDPAAGTVEMEHRSEAGQPLRAFGGQ